jgi:transposase-like protein
VLQEADRASEAGQIGALLRREGLYSSHLCDWRREREAGQLAGLSGKPRGRKPSAAEQQAREIARLSRENARLAERLRQAELIIEAQKKLAQLLGESPTSEPS